MTKDLLKSNSQILTDTLFFKYFKGEANNTFVLYSNEVINYSIKLNVKKHKYSLIGKTYRKKYVKPFCDVGFDFKDTNGVYINTAKGKKAKLKMHIKGKDFDRKYNVKL